MSFSQLSDNQIVDINLGYYITKIPAYGSFGGTNALAAIKNITFSPCIESIGDYSFDSFVGTGDLYICSSKLTEIGSGAFQKSSFSNVHVECQSSIGQNTFGQMQNVESFYVKAIDIVGRNPFASGSSGYAIRKAYIEVDSISSNADSLFGGNCPIEELTLVGSDKENPLECTSTTATFFALSSNTHLKNVKLVNVKKMLYSGEFAGCSNLTKIDFGEKIEELGNSFFANCTSLKEVTFPSTFHNVAKQLFDYSGIETVIFKGSVKSLGKYVFRGCNNLKVIDFSNNLSTGPSTEEGNPFDDTFMNSIEEIRIFNSYVAEYFDDDTYFQPYISKFVIMH